MLSFRNRACKKRCRQGYRQLQACSCASLKDYRTQLAREFANFFRELPHADFQLTVAAEELGATVEPGATSVSLLV
jgi:hypothetical protein